MFTYMYMVDIISQATWLASYLSKPCLGTCVISESVVTTKETFVLLHWLTSFSIVVKVPAPTCLTFCCIVRRSKAQLLHACMYTSEVIAFGWVLNTLSRYTAWYHVKL